MNKPKVTVAICNYNHSKYLRQSIESIVSQRYSDLDIAVVDDGSNDQEKVKEIIDSFKDKRIRSIYLNKNLGKWNALNVAFQTSSSEICTSHDADDVSLDWRIESQIEVLTKTRTAHNLCGFIPCWSEDEINSSQSISKPQSIRYVSGEEVTKSVAYGFQTPGINHYFTGKFETAGVSSMFLRSAWAAGIRFNPPSVGLRIMLSEDSDFNCRMTLLLGSTSILLESPYLYRRNTSTNKEEM